MPVRTLRQALQDGERERENIGFPVAHRICPSELYDRPSRMERERVWFPAAHSICPSELYDKPSRRENFVLVLCVLVPAQVLEHERIKTTWGSFCRFDKKGKQKVAWRFRPHKATPNVRHQCVCCLGRGERGKGVWRWGKRETNSYKYVFTLFLDLELLCLCTHISCCTS